MFKNLVTLVTGGAGGLGRATVNRFANNGSKVVLVDLPSSNGEEVAREIGENAQYIAADIASEEDMKNVVSKISEKYGKLDVVVNCAGICRSYATYNFKIDKPARLSDFTDVIETNVIGTFNVIRLVAGLMDKNEPDANGMRGVIVNTAGVEAFRGGFSKAGNAAASGAIHSMTKPFATELGEHGIRVITLAPGIISTPLNNYFPKDVEESISNDGVIAPNRFGEPDEFAHLVQSVVQNPYINGTTIELSAGLDYSVP